MIASAIKKGDSVAVSGACLTAVGFDGASFDVQVMNETLRATKIGTLKPGSRVNLERAMRADGRLDGHIVQGHVDEVGKVVNIERSSDRSGSIKITVSASRHIAWGIARKGSICLDGVSLTVVDSEADSFSVALIPLTMAETTIGSMKVGDLVNIEIDVLARYMARIMSIGISQTENGDGGITYEKLRSYGWL